MKIFFSPGACSLASHIALHESGAAFDSESVDLKTKTTASGGDFEAINVKGYVPAITLDGGELLTENIAILDYLAGEFPQLGLEGPMGRTRLVEALAFISTEIHKSYKPFWRGGSDEDKAAASAYITKRMAFLADRIGGDFLLGDSPSVADFYLFVTMLWAEKFGVTLPPKLGVLHERLKSRPGIIATMRAEGLG